MLPSGLSRTKPLCGIRQVTRAAGCLRTLGLICCMLFANGCDRTTTGGPPVSDPAVLLEGGTMGTTYHVRLTALPKGATASQLQRRVQQRLDEIESRMSTYQQDSELSRFNRHRGDDWFPVSKETVLVVSAAKQVSIKSNGAFDVTVGPLVNLWRFGPDRKRPLAKDALGNVDADQLPSDAAIEAARSHVGYQKLRIQLDPPALRKTHPDLYVDLSAVAKGYAVDEVYRLLNDLETGSFMVEIGGEVRTRGERDGGGPWRIAIETPDTSRRVINKVVGLTDLALATSGDYRNFYRVDGKIYSHTIDPRSGRPVAHQLASVSVLHDECMWADAWATAFMVMGPKLSTELAAKEQMSVLLIRRTSDDYPETMTPSFRARVLNNAQ